MDAMAAWSTYFTIYQCAIFRTNKYLLIGNILFSCLFLWSESMKHMYVEDKTIIIWYMATNPLANLAEHISQVLCIAAKR